MEAQIKSFEQSTLLDEPIEFTLVGVVYPKWYQFWKKKKEIERIFRVKRLRTWQNIKIQSRLAKIDKDILIDKLKDPVWSAYGYYVNNHIEDLIYITAVCLSEDPGKEPDRELIELIRSSMDNASLKHIWDVMIVQTDSTPFMNGIISTRGIVLMTEMNPTT